MTQSDFTYSAFGLLLASNLNIPGLVPTEAPSSVPSVRLHLGVSPGVRNQTPPGPEELIYTSSYLDESGEPALRVWRLEGRGILRLAYSDGMQFWLDQGGNNVWALWPGSSSLGDVATYLLGPVLGALLRLKGVICLHASAVAFEDRAVAFVGPPGAGKSTTAALLAQHGCAVLSDDVVALAENAGFFQVLPAYPFLSLWPDSVAMLYGSPDSLPRFIPHWEKRRLALGQQECKFEKRSLPLRAIYLLRERTADLGPQIEPVSARAAFIDLVTNSYATKILDCEMRARELRFLGRLISSVPIRLIRLSQESSCLEGSFTSIFLDTKEVGSAWPAKDAPPGLTEPFAC